MTWESAADEKTKSEWRKRTCCHATRRGQRTERMPTGLVEPGSERKTDVRDSLGDDGDGPRTYCSSYANIAAKSR